MRLAKRAMLSRVGRVAIPLLLVSCLMAVGFHLSGVVPSRDAWASAKTDADDAEVNSDAAKAGAWTYNPIDTVDYNLYCPEYDTIWIDDIAGHNYYDSGNDKAGEALNHYAEGDAEMNDESVHYGHAEHDWDAATNSASWYYQSAEDRWVDAQAEIIVCPGASGCPHEGM